MAEEAEVIIAVYCVVANSSIAICAAGGASWRV